ncbi:MAG: hypothetical protein PHN82_10110 [bacterium]|nr:hypothetical protein [bacterium]
MKRKRTVEEVIGRLVERDGRYGADAYEFVLEALDCTYRMLGERRHVRGGELLEGARRHALDRYGPMSRTVLEHWGIRRCEDIGEIVFNLVDGGVLNATEGDSRDDFKGGYDFRQAFDDAFGGRDAGG